MDSFGGLRQSALGRFSNGIRRSKLMKLAVQDICGSKAASRNKERLVTKKTKKKAVVRREYTKADVKELRTHSKARTPVAKLAKLTRRSVGSLRQKALKLGIGLGHQR
jgi:hypothetical protein